MQYTDVYSLRKPQMAETASVSDINYNADRIDAIMSDNRQISVAMYVSGNTYNTGDLVGYENPSTHHIRVYRCLVDNVTGTWDSTKWTLTNLADEILDAKASGGTEVEANPTGTPSDTMHTVEIDGVIYAVGGDSANQNIADAFSELQTYDVGDYCIYESILYKCTTAVQTAGAWDSTKWTSCVVTDEMGSGGGGSVPDMTGATASTPGTHGLVPAPAAGDNTKFLRGDGTWQPISDGGGSGSYTETTLWSGTQASTGQGVTINLEDNISNYDMIVFECGRQSDIWQKGNVIYLVSDLVLNTFYLQVVNVNNNINCYWEYSADSSILWASAYSAYPVTLFSVKGLKFGSSGHIYSTAEQDTGDVWVDGKPIYETTYVLSNLSGYPSDWVSMGALSVDKVIDTSGGASKSNGEHISIYNTSVRLCYNPVIHQGDFCYYYAQSDNNITDMWITIRYTKPSA